MSPGLQQALSVFVPKMHELVRTDEEAVVVMSALDGYAEVLKAVGPPVLQGEGHLDAVLSSVRDVMAYKVGAAAGRPGVGQGLMPNRASGLAVSGGLRPTL